MVALKITDGSLVDLELEDAPTAFDRGVIGKDCRILIPMSSQVRLRDVAKVLHALGNRLDALSRDPDLKPRHALYDATAHCHAAQRKINEIYKRTREHKPKKQNS